MIPLWGWRSVLQLGGIAPLILTVLLVRFLPESIRFMVANQQGAERIRSVLMHISNTVKDAASFTMSERRSAKKGQSGPVIVVSASYIVGSLMMWIAYFMGLVIFYALINWMPILFRDAGIAPRTATLISALFPLGGVGAILFGWFMDRYNGNWIIAIGYGLTAIFIYAIGQSVGTIGLLMAIVFIAGTMMNTAQSSMPALAASFYPTQGRATGVAWMLLPRRGTLAAAIDVCGNLHGRGNPWWGCRGGTGDQATRPSGTEDPWSGERC
jgi:AAHS family 4-hydroxybenzoate transporter-like MFS transporter